LVTFLINPFTCFAEVLRVSDTHASEEDAKQLATFLDTMTDGQIVIGLTADEAMSNLSPALPALSQLGVDVADVENRGSFAFIVQKGYLEKTVISKVLSEEQSNTHPAHFSVAITGNNLHRHDSSGGNFF